MLRAGHYPPILALVNSSRIDKLLSSFGVTLAALVSPVTGRIHAHYQVAAAATGRATAPAQTCSKFRAHQYDFRTLFIPEPGNVLVVADYARWSCALPPTFLAIAR